MKRLIICLTLLIFLSSPVFGATFYVTPTGLGDKSGSDPSNSMDTAAFVAETQAVTMGADDWFFLAGGGPDNGVVGSGTCTYDVGATAANIGDNVESGTAFQPIMIAGITPFDTTSTSNAYPGWKGSLCSGASRPFIQLGAQQILVNDYWHFHRVMIEGTADNMLDGDTGVRFSGCSIFNVSPIANREAIFAATQQSVIYNNEISSSLGDAVYAASANYIAYNIIHHSEDAIALMGGTAEFNIIHNIVDAGMIQSSLNTLIQFNTFYNVGTAISCDADDANIRITNNIFDTCTVAIDSEKDAYARVIDYNNYWNNGTDIADGSGNAQKGANATAYDPNFTNYVPDAESGVTSAGKAMKVIYGDGS